ncbi:MAG: phosphomannomutase/phosphoglucomutase [Clostridia bacterium]|nr:phosphomannomutase/phosphoglucomutase [Clostridia bacterium]
MKDYSKLQNGSDVRGVASDMLGKQVNLTAEAASDIAFGFGTWLSDAAGKKADDMRVAVGRDSRVTGPGLQEAVCSTLNGMGFEVLDCGLASTPAMFMSCVFPETACDGAVMITASHLPPDRNGLKFFEKEKGGLDKADISDILKLAALAQKVHLIKQAENAWKPYPLMNLYCAHLKTRIAAILGLTEDDSPLGGLRVCVDAGNGAGGFYAGGVLEPLGADVSGSQFLEPDGLFPNHAPNPEDAAAVASLSRRVLETGADLGIIFDTDVDRMAVVGHNGKDIARNGIVALAALLCPPAEDGSRGTIVTDSITSTQLADFLKANGFAHLRFKRGYKNVINKGRELNAAGTYCPLAIETSGHAALKENYFLDDGAYLAAKVVARAAQMKAEGRHIEDLLAGLDEPAEAAEFRLAVNAKDFASYADGVLEGLREAIASGSVPGMSLELPNYEGVRVNCCDGWFLIRKSLHDPLMPLNIESDGAGGVARIAAAVRSLLEPFDQLDVSKLG